MLASFEVLCLVNDTYDRILKREILNDHGYDQGMAHPLRIEYRGTAYHITSRGQGREDIYRSDDDSAMFPGVLAHMVERFGWFFHACAR